MRYAHSESSSRKGRLVSQGCWGSTLGYVLGLCTHCVSDSIGWSPSIHLQAHMSSTGIPQEGSSGGCLLLLPGQPPISGRSGPSELCLKSTFTPVYVRKSRNGAQKKCNTTSQVLLVCRSRSPLSGHQQRTCHSRLFVGMSWHEGTANSGASVIDNLWLLASELILLP